MSFILDAIAKSEQERQLQEMPGARVLATPVTDTQKPRRYLPYLLIGVLLLNAVLVMIWMQTDQSLPSPIEDMEQSSGQGKVPENAQTTEVVTQIESMSFKNKSSTKPQITSANETRDTTPALISQPELEPLAPLASMTNDNILSAGALKNNHSREQVTEIESRTLPSKPIVEQRSMTDASQSSMPESVQSEILVKETSEDTTAWIHIGPDSLSNKTNTGQNVEPEERTQNSSTLYRKVSSLRELPDDVRKALPRVSFSGHLYSSNSRISVVFTGDGRPVKQGQEIEKELYLHEITPTGVIVEFRGYLIKVGVLQNWTLN